MLSLVFSAAASTGLGLAFCNVAVHLPRWEITRAEKHNVGGRLSEMVTGLQRHISLKLGTPVE